MSREYTTEEVRDKFLRHAQNVLEYWLEDSRAVTTREKMEGMLFSLLAAIDGSSADLPGFILAPNTPPTDKEFHQSRGENWFPDNSGVEIKCDIGGSLHSKIGAYRGEQVDKSMTLEEAIEHAEAIGGGCDACANEHLQLAMWLTELKLRRNEKDVQEKLRPAGGE